MSQINKIPEHRTKQIPYMNLGIVAKDYKFISYICRDCSYRFNEDIYYEISDIIENKQIDLMYHLLKCPECNREMLITLFNKKNSLGIKVD